MPTTVIVIRHCEAEGNIKRIFQGHTDGAVSERGLAQLELLSGKAANIPIDVIYSSPLTRAYTTALAVKGKRDISIIFDERLKELNGGQLEGVRWTEFPDKFPEHAKDWNLYPWRFQAPNGESMVQVADRMFDAVSDIARQNAGKTIAVTTHGCAIRCLICRAKGWPLERLNDVDWCDNTSLSVIVFDDDFNPDVTVENDREHLSRGMSAMDEQSWWKKENRDNLDFSD